MTVKFEIKDQLAKLLATEDLVVEHKKVLTASFNVSTRVLVLPMWEKASNNVYAPKVSRSDMLYRMLETKTATYLTRHKRDWIHVDDVVYAIATLMPSTYTGVIDVGTGNPVAVIDLAMKMGMGHLPIKEETPGERDITCADTTELRKLGWMPTINILDTV